MSLTGLLRAIGAPPTELTVPEAMGAVYLAGRVVTVRKAGNGEGFDIGARILECNANPRNALEQFLQKCRAASSSRSSRTLETRTESGSTD